MFRRMAYPFLPSSGMIRRFCLQPDAEENTLPGSFFSLVFPSAAAVFPTSPLLHHTARKAYILLDLIYIVPEYPAKKLPLHKIKSHVGSTRIT